MGYIIREKEYKDCDAWVNVNISSWNDNLKGIVSDRILRIIIDNKEERIKKDKLSFSKDDNNLVLEENGNIVGILKIKKSDRKGFEDCGEVQILYLLSSSKGKGYGKTLLDEGFKRLKEKGFKKVIIGCLDKNPSNEFYKHMGGKYIRQDIFNIFDELYLENIYCYDLNI